MNVVNEDEYEADIIDKVMLNTEYKADIKIHQGRELDMHEKPETRDVMNNITDVVMLNMEYEAGMVDIIDAIMLNTEYEADIIDNVKLNTEYEADIIHTVMLNTEYEVGVKDYQGRKLIMYEKLETRNGMLKTNPKGKYDKNVNVDIIDTAMLNPEDEAGIKVQQGRELIMPEKSKTRMGCSRPIPRASTTRTCT
jgi:hypothetical protein